MVAFRRCPCFCILVASFLIVSYRVTSFSLSETSYVGFRQRWQAMSTKAQKQITQRLLSVSSATSSSNFGDEEEFIRGPQYAPLDSYIEDERRPRPSSQYSSSVRRHQDYRGDWGVCQADKQLEFPRTIDAVVDGAFEAIAGTLHHKEKPDPNVVSNARSNSLFDYRPCRKGHDSGRMGIEVDGAQYLFPGGSQVSPARATRRLSLLLAAKLSQNKNWEKFETEATEDSHSDNKKSKEVQISDGEYRPVAVYVNTIKQALMASQELKLLKRAEMEETRSKSTSFDHVYIQYLGEDIPQDMRIDRSVRRRYRGLTNGYVDAARGIVMIVQPTDFNSEYRPPGPAIGAVSNLQCLIAKASIEELPTVVVSPRFLANESPFGGGNSWDQSGYQKSSTYGGVEPPKGPTPWVMRDFTPPLFCWVGNAISLMSSRARKEQQKQIEDIDAAACYFSRVALTQSVMDRDHEWHMFAAKECSVGRRRLPTTYKYLASTRSASGRPTRDIIQRILNDLRLQ